MNFNELMQRMRDLDQPMVEEPNEGNLFTGNLAAARAAGKDEADLDGDGDMEKVKEDDIGECGMDMSPRPMPQQDNVTMNLSMNGSGSGGIRDLLDILKNIDGEDGSGDQLGRLMGKMDKEPIIGDKDMPVDEFANSPEPVQQDTAFMTHDLAGGINGPKDMYKHSYRMGDNPMAMEGLITRLGSLYQEVKSR